MTDPSFAGQLISFTYPHIGNYGVSAEAMESERPWARAAIMREACNHEDAPTAERGWLDWLTDCGVQAISGVDTRALVRHIREAGAMRGGVFPATIAEREARELIEAEPPMAGQDLARVVTPRGRLEPRRGRKGRGSPSSTPASRPRWCASSCSVARASSCTHAPAGRGAARRRPRRGLPGQRPRRPGRALLHRPDGPGDRRQEARVGHLPRPPAALPGGRPGDVQAAVRPPRRQPSGPGPADRPRRDHLAEPRLRRARTGRRANDRRRRAGPLGDGLRRRRAVARQPL